MGLLRYGRQMYRNPRELKPELNPSRPELREILAGVRPGAYDVGELYPIYLTWLERSRPGETPVRENSFACALRRLVGNRTGRGWRIEREHLEPEPTPRKPCTCSCTCGAAPLLPSAQVPNQS